MRLLVVAVNTTTSMTDQIAAQAQSVPPPGTHIVGLTPPLALGAILCQGTTANPPRRTGRPRPSNRTRTSRPDTVGQPTG